MLTEQIRQSGETEYSVEQDYAGYGVAEKRDIPERIGKRDAGEERGERLVVRLTSPTVDIDLFTAALQPRDRCATPCEKSIIRGTVLRRHYRVRLDRCNSLASHFHIALVETCVPARARKRVNVRNSIPDDITAIALRHAWRARHWKHVRTRLFFSLFPLPSLPTTPVVATAVA